MATAKRRAASKVKRPEVVVDKALKQRWTIEMERLKEARASETAGWDELYEALGEIVASDPPLYLAGGYKTARDFLKKELPDKNERTLRSYIRVARHFDPEDEVKHGITKLELLLDYLEVAGGAPLAPAKIRLSKQKVRVASDKASRLVPFDEVTVEQLRSAIRVARSSSGKVGKAQPPLVKEIRKALAGKGIGSVGVSLRNKLVVLTVAPAKLTALCKALAAAKLPNT
jgi:hypothetical protein